jgi:hypothetical protein
MITFPRISISTQNFPYAVYRHVFYFCTKFSHGRFAVAEREERGFYVFVLHSTKMKFKICELLEVILEHKIPGPYIERCQYHSPPKFAHLECYY